MQYNYQCVHTAGDLKPCNIQRKCLLVMLLPSLLHQTLCIHSKRTQSRGIRIAPHRCNHSFAFYTLNNAIPRAIDVIRNSCGAFEIMSLVTMRIVTILLLISLLPFNTRGQATCDIQGGQYRYCQCKMSDGSGIVDLSPYADEDGNAE